MGRGGEGGGGAYVDCCFAGLVRVGRRRDGVRGEEQGQDGPLELGEMQPARRTEGQEPPSTEGQEPVLYWPSVRPMGEG
jgi:hypothetical protein